MRTNLDSDPRVIALAAELKVPELHVVGMLWKVWSWADSHSIDGNAICVTDVTLDRFTAFTGFSAVLRKVGWLEGRDGALTFPRFAEHNGQTAKKRAETAIRVAKSRNAKSVTDVTQKVLPDKRRGEEIRDKEKTKAKKNLFKPPSVEEVAAYCVERRNDIDPEAFVAHYAASGWKRKGGEKVVDWRSCVITWEKNRRPTDKPDPSHKPLLPPKPKPEPEGTLP